MTDPEGHSKSGKTTIIMFAGKGGVGKTTCAATAALHSAASGKRTLAISTDGTPSLSHIFEIETGGRLAKVKELLSINELGVEEVKEMWDSRFGPEVYQVFSSVVDVDYPQFVDFMTSLLPGLSDEFMVDYIRDLSQKGEYGTIIWDTAPLGQTLALLKTPVMLWEHLKLAPRIYSKLKVGGQKSKESILDILRRWGKLSSDNMDFLRNEVNFTVVTIAEALAVEQLDGIFKTMFGNGFPVTRLIINNVVKTQDSDFLRTKAKQQKLYLDLLHSKYCNLQIIELPLFPYEMKGWERLKEAEKALFEADHRQAP